jgi:hypothetical protein
MSHTCERARHVSVSLHSRARARHSTFKIQSPARAPPAHRRRTHRTRARREAHARTHPSRPRPRAHRARSSTTRAVRRRNPIRVCTFSLTAHNFPRAHNRRRVVANASRATSHIDATHAPATYALSVSLRRDVEATAEVVAMTWAARSEALRCWFCVARDARLRRVWFS